MSAKPNWNTQPKTDTVAFSALIATAAFLAWLAAATSVPGINAAPEMTQAVVQPADQTHDSRIVITASRLTKING
jgi:Spy/CpxP family protein refolding chaperone